MLSSIEKSKIPIVYFDRCIEGARFSCISVDHKDAARKITQHLIDHGIDKIAHISGPQKVSLGKKRLEEYLDALIANNIEINEKWIVEAGMHEHYGRSAMKTILSLPKAEWPRAVFAVNDPVTFGAIDVKKEHGLIIPDDIAVVGFSD